VSQNYRARVWLRAGDRSPNLIGRLLVWAPVSQAVGIPRLVGQVVTQLEGVAEAAGRIERCCRAFGLFTPPATQRRVKGECQGAFVGLGVTSSGQHSLNLYLKR
jgi:hypothetical protein